MPHSRLNFPDRPNQRCVSILANSVAKLLNLACRASLNRRHTLTRTLFLFTLYDWQTVQLEVNLYPQKP